MMKTYFRVNCNLMISVQYLINIQGRSAEEFCERIGVEENEDRLSVF